MFFLTLIATVLNTAAVSATARLGRPLTAAALAIGRAQFVPLDDADIDRAVADLQVGITAAHATRSVCEDELLPAAVRAHPAPARAPYAETYRAFLGLYAHALVDYRDEFLRQRSRPPAARTTEGVRERSNQINELMRRAHERLRQVAPRAELP